MSNSRAVIALSPPPSEWHPILHSSGQVVLYNPRSHAVTISSSLPAASTLIATRRPRPCPYCRQDLPPGFESRPDGDSDEEDVAADDLVHDADPAYHSRASNYFQLLAVSNETISRPSSPPPIAEESTSSNFMAEQMAEGYFKRFFQEEYRLGMGANGSVFLCQHMLDGNPLGHFAVKKIAVGESHSYLLSILREVRLLERLHHPNIVTYHHSWLETSQFSSFGPRIPTLHVLMQWAEGGSLDDFIDIRQGKKPAHPHIHPVPNVSTFSRFEVASDTTAFGDNSPQVTPTPSEDFEGSHSRSKRIKAFRAFQRASPDERERMLREGYGSSERPKDTKNWAPVHLLSADEIKSLFQDVVEGLGFLHAKSILHLDLKPGNVLLTWDDGKMIPRAMLSDFGTSRDMINSNRMPRSGNTGTLEYASPESLPTPGTGVLQQIDSKSDMWSLGMILHKMLFFKLPYRYAAEGDANGESISLGSGQEGQKMERLEQEILQYPGFKATGGLVTSFEARRLPRAYLVLLESLLHKVSPGRPSCDRVVLAVREGKLDPLKEVPHRSGSSSPMTLGTVVPVRRGSPPRPNTPPPATPATTATIEETADLVVQVEDDPTPSSHTTPVVGDDMKHLLLPSPAEILGPDDSKLSSRSLGSLASVARMKAKRSKAWKLLNRRMKSHSGRVGLRLARSCLLVVKVLSIPRICGDTNVSFDMVYPRQWLVTALIGTAVADTVVEVEPWHRGLLASFGLGLLHALVVRYGAVSGLCCST